MTARAAWPWTTTALVTANVAMYVLAGSATDYTTSSAGNGEDAHLPSVEQLTFDVFRNPSTAAMTATVAFLLPIGAALERSLNGVAVGSTYLVSGFAAGFVGMFAIDESLPVVGAYGAITGLLAMWVVTRWREHRDAVLPVAVVVAWLLINAQVRGPGSPALASAAAAGVGLYGIGALSALRRGALQTPPTGRR